MNKHQPTTHSRKSRRVLALANLLILTAAVGCSSRDKGASKTPTLSAAQGDAYTPEEVVSLSNTLVAELEMPADQQARVLAKLDRVLNEAGYRPGIQEKITSMGITGVVAYRLGEGGVVVTVKKGRAVGQLKGSSEHHWFKLGGTDLGAQLAASREWGVFLVLGLPEGGDLGGTYRGVQKSASAGRGAGTTEMASGREDHRLVFLGAGSGVSLDVSGARLKIKDGKE